MSLKSLHPLEWFEIPRTSHSPSLRVGHSSTFLPSSSRILLLSGANPSECFADVYSLSLPSNTSETFLWTKLIAHEKVLQRYEHSAVLSTINGEKIVFFGGANTESNFNDVHAFDLSTQTIENWTPKDNQLVSPRTHHSSCSVGNAFYIFSGGFQGVKAVDDAELYRFDFVTRCWSCVPTRGIPPDQRHGHVLVSLENRYLYLHGGMDGRRFFSSLHSIDLNEKSPQWKEHSSSTSNPSARAAHGAVALEKNCTIILFGGLSRQGQALNDVWSWSRKTEQWTEIVCRSSPRSRLDFAYCFVLFRDENEEKKEIPFLFLHGGTDTNGEIFDDSFLLRLIDDED